MILTEEEMVEAVWNTGNVYEAAGGKLDEINQKLRFRWIAQAQIDKLIKQGWRPPKGKDVK